MHLVGINGFKQAGKGTTAQILNELLEDDIVYEVGFADKLKTIAALSLGIEGSPRDLISYMDEFKLEGDIWYGCGGDHDMKVSGRQFLQHLGNHARIVFGDNFWIDQVLPYAVRHTPGMDALDHSLNNSHRLQQMYPDVDVVAITDLRYPNEAERVKSLGGVVWVVQRAGITSDGHASEQPLADELVDWYIHNDGTFDDLKHEVQTAIEETLNHA